MCCKVREWSTSGPFHVQFIQTKGFSVSEHAGWPSWPYEITNLMLPINPEIKQTMSYLRTAVPPYGEHEEINHFSRMILILML